MTFFVDKNSGQRARTKRKECRKNERRPRTQSLPRKRSLQTHGNHPLPESGGWLKDRRKSFFIWAPSMFKSMVCKAPYVYMRSKALTESAHARRQKKRNCSSPCPMLPVRVQAGPFHVAVLPVAVMWFCARGSTTRVQPKQLHPPAAPP